MAGAIKKTTGLTGLAVAKNPEHKLRVVYGRIIKALKKIPSDAAYRKYTEEIIQNRLQVVIDSKNYEEIEKKINCGQVEELISQAEQELVLARKLALWKPWEPLVTQAPPNQWTWPPNN
uniref:NADH dehydrogenase (Ubiquinone) 1 alpha subcomplex, 5-like protein n=1 Tax=Maconellicoccus hirsutus TaxID=177089 RepID=A2I409_MACHI|nr:NADH dehydrogenase (ubiquinone) 1 alpha subcomplex, 5-like protein [Maconellicoccus hirsutus]